MPALQPLARLTDQVHAGPGGAMTVEAGVITGDLTVTTTNLGTHAEITIQYTGADEWYHLQGSPAPVPQAGLTALHYAVVDAIRSGAATGVPH
ncbi:hypothetical protein GA0115240_11775 [Streptomyces sp. DvalAA-14]|uniref:hypothetical protein n=1 Tax=unclassified Streptomyces TaxID=2593676 RepID=UPI00081B86DA|nr:MULTISPECIES: hypothetical protein [unclassified Streptomyces]MYS20212.1 hypothetical protein [Streptomyces sp. SID4948]SCD63653.1 hypothetical protein GA0115240_11775 [Streptomyces sp. DvalAA-14]